MTHNVRPSYKPSRILRLKLGLVGDPGRWGGIGGRGVRTKEEGGRDCSPVLYTIPKTGEAEPEAWLKPVSYRGA